MIHFLQFFKGLKIRLLINIIDLIDINHCLSDFINTQESQMGPKTAYFDIFLLLQP